MLYENRFKWMLPALLFAAWIIAACVVQPVTMPAQTPGTVEELPAEMQATVDALRTQVAAQLQVAPEAIAVVAAEAVDWPDACLGAGGPAESCALVVTPGYRVTLAVDGDEYVYHTDRGPYWLRLAQGPAVDVGTPVITATVTVDNGSCQDARVGAQGVAFGYCGGALFGGKFVTDARPATLATFAARYAPFTASTAAGTITFAGSGDRVATAAEQEALAAWTQRLVMEAASGVPMGGLAWNGPTEPGSDDTSKCATLTMGGGEATIFDCAGNVQSIKLNGGPLSTWLALQDHHASFTLETATERLDFTGMGAEQSDAWQRALLAWARTQYAELSSGKVSAAGNTVLAWKLGPTEDDATRCRHLTVLAWGEAYAEERPCAGGDVLGLATGWLETPELETLDAWLTGNAPLTAEEGYVAGTGPQAPGPAEMAAVEQWAAAVWLRLRGDATPQEIGATPAACPAPSAGEEVFVNAADGYCLLLPAGYVAETTAPGNTSIVQGSIMNHVDPRVGIEVTDAGGRTLDEIGEQFVAEFAPGFPVARGTTTVGGEDALVLDNLPGQDLNRRVAVIRDGRLYSFFFTPLGEEGEARSAFESFYQGILDSFEFLE